MIFPHPPIHRTANCGSADNEYVYGANFWTVPRNLVLLSRRQTPALWPAAAIALPRQVSLTGRAARAAAVHCLPVLLIAAIPELTVASLIPPSKSAPQCWFAKNLDIGTRVDSGSASPCVDVSGQGWGVWSCQTGTNPIEKYCYNNNLDVTDNVTPHDIARLTAASMNGPKPWAFRINAINADFSSGSSDCGIAGGGTYTINAEHQGICPTGWHIPSNAEWYTLTGFVISNLGCDFSKRLFSGRSLFEKAVQFNRPVEQSCRIRLLGRVGP